MLKPFTLVLIVMLFAFSTAYAQDLPKVQIPQSLRVQTATKSQESPIRPAYLLPPQSSPNAGSAKQSSTVSHKKRNIIIAVVVAAAVGGIVVAAHNGVYGSSGTGY